MNSIQLQFNDEEEEILLFLHKKLWIKDTASLIMHVLHEKAESIRLMEKYNNNPAYNPMMLNDLFDTKNREQK